MILGYQDMASYLTDPFYLGALAGRVANRISGAGFSLGGDDIRLAANEGANMLHGGPGGLSRRFWAMEPRDPQTVRWKLHSPEGDQGFPGAVDIVCDVSLREASLIYEMSATVDRPTPINLAQHNYYCLGRYAEIWDHRLWVAFRERLETTQDGLPTGNCLALGGTRYVFSGEQSFAELDPHRRGYDTHFNFNPSANRLREVARLTAPDGVTLTVTSDQSGAQIYTAGHLQTSQPGQEGSVLSPFSGVCIEPQGYPDAVNQPTFPSIIVEPGSPYHQRLELSFSSKGS